MLAGCHSRHEVVGGAEHVDDLVDVPRPGALGAPARPRRPRGRCGKDVVDDDHAPRMAVAPVLMKSAARTPTVHASMNARSRAAHGSARRDAGGRRTRRSWPARGEGRSGAVVHHVVRVDADARRRGVGGLGGSRVGGAAPLPPPPPGGGRADPPAPHPRRRGAAPPTPRAGRPGEGGGGGPARGPGPRGGGGGVRGGSHEPPPTSSARYDGAVAAVIPPVGQNRAAGTGEAIDFRNAAPPDASAGKNFSSV